ncbi:hypothetical protein [Estrella lausannensis]|uniref:Conserved putative membrane protein n=1 Tax=Estrella lausannensis TaxID=483423 RepID=A0A0H5DN99_9BACT|nr:hypothetical protein [Estrella lausannensis]CRX37597.1 Conserved putative membrane protein [Estrella lausannensis]
MSVNLNPTTSLAVSADQKAIQAKPVESGWSGRKIALAVLGTIAAVASVVGTVFLVMMLTKKNESESKEGEQAPLQLVTAKESEESVIATSETRKSEAKEEKPLSLFHPQKTRPKVNHRPPTRTLHKNQDQELPSTKKDELTLSQFMELPKQSSADTSKDLEIALKLQQEIDEAFRPPMEDVSQDEAIAKALAMAEPLSKPTASRLARVKKHHITGSTTFTLPHGVTKANYVPWAFAEAKKNWVQAH